MEKLALPTKQQIRWQDLEMGVFCHFGLNTFNDREWGDGTDSVEAFNPVALDARQWVRTARDAGFKYFMLTAKHHDGFCLWQTDTTAYSVKSSPWKGGIGDVVAECAQACREEGILFGLYLSPWDRHEPCYADKKAYDDFYSRQLTELMTCYGPLVEIWFDGAGSEGREYDWERYMALVEKYQPEAMVFNMGRPTIRWVGNEEGTAPYPCWNSAAEAKLSIYTERKIKFLPGTPEWLPAECDVPIHREHWFWHPKDDSSLLTLEELMKIYCESVGHGANLLLNVAPDNRGVIPENDVKRVLEFGNEIRRKFSSPLAITAGTGEVLELKLQSVQLVDTVVIMEDIAHGERIRSYDLDVYSNGAWVRVVEGSAIGHKKIDRFRPILTDTIRLSVTESKGEARIKNFSAYLVNLNGGI